jgi:hypothetical protein
MFEQTQENSAMNVDTEDAEQIDEVHVGVNKALLSQKDCVRSLIWSNKRNIFYISTNSETITRNDLVRIGETVKIK